MTTHTPRAKDKSKPGDSFKDGPKLKPGVIPTLSFNGSTADLPSSGVSLSSRDDSEYPTPDASDSQIERLRRRIAKDRTQRDSTD